MLKEIWKKIKILEKDLGNETNLWKHSKVDSAGFYTQHKRYKNIKKYEWVFYVGVIIPHKDIKKEKETEKKIEEK